jgi:hypothetical protein
MAVAPASRAARCRAPVPWVGPGALPAPDGRERRDGDRGACRCAAGCAQQFEPEHAPGSAPPDAAGVAGPGRCAASGPAARAELQCGAARRAAASVAAWIDCWASRSQAPGSPLACRPGPRIPFAAACRARSRPAAAVRHSRRLRRRLRRQLAAAACGRWPWQWDGRWRQQQCRQRRGGYGGKISGGQWLVTAAGFEAGRSPSGRCQGSRTRSWPIVGAARPCARLVCASVSAGPASTRPWRRTTMVRLGQRGRRVAR